MTADLVIRNGTVVDGTGGAAAPGRRRHRRATASSRWATTSAAGRRELDADGPAGDPGLRRSPHPLRRPGHLGPAAGPVVPPRGDHRGHGQLRRRLRPGGPGPPRLAHRHDGRRRGHPRHRPARGPAVGLGVVPRVPRRPRPPTPDHRRGHPPAPRRPAGLRDGRAGRRSRRASRRRASSARWPSCSSEGLDAGAIGVSTSRTERHRTSTGENLGTLRAREPELLALASVLRATGQRGLPVPVGQLPHHRRRVRPRRSSPWSREFARTSRRPVSYTVQQDIEAPERWRDLMALAVSLQAEGLDVKAQVAPRPIGVLLGLEASANVFTPARAYARIAGLPLAERVAALRDPERRRRILEGHAELTSGDDAFAGYAFFGRFDDMYVLDDPVNYNLDSSRSLGGDGPPGRASIPASTPTTCSCSGTAASSSTRPLFNFAHGNLDAVHEMITSPVAMFGLSDAGAHCGQICDGSMTTTLPVPVGPGPQGPGRHARRVGGAPDHPPPGRPLRLARPGRGRPGLPGRPQRHRPRAAWSAPRPRSPPTCRPAGAGCCRRPPGTGGRSSGVR